jgi:hypothetical protein
MKTHFTAILPLVINTMPMNMGRNGDFIGKHTILEVIPVVNAQLDVLGTQSQINQGNSLLMSQSQLQPGQGLNSPNPAIRASSGKVLENTQVPAAVVVQPTLTWDSKDCPHIGTEIINGKISYYCSF